MTHRKDHRKGKDGSTKGMERADDCVLSDKKPGVVRER